MAVFKHRKLFPFSANQSTNCLNFCDSTCPYKCNPIPYPDLIFPPPQPISPPPAFKTRDMPLSPSIIITVTLLSSFFLFVTYYAITVKNCGGCRENSENESPSSDQLDDDLDQNHGLIIDHNHHPIWFIATVGLQQSVINSLTAVKYKKGEGLIEGTECLVCLNEFQEDEMLRVLPKCNHAFHIHCIDTWLRSHTNCPLCRANIVVSDAVSTPSLGSTESNSISLSGNEDTQMGIHENDGLQHEHEHVVVDNDDDERRAKEDVNSNGNLDSPPEAQTIPRSISMDSASTASICLDMATFHSEGSSNYMMISKVRKSDSTKRSFSCSGRSLFLEQSPKSIQFL